jgi:hypothetical protein
MAIKTFTTGEVLTAADTNTYLANSGLVFIKQQTIGSAVSAVTVTNAFSTDYDDYFVTITGGVAGTTISLNLTLGSTATGYLSSILYSLYATGTVGGITGGTTFIQYAGTADVNRINMGMKISNPFNAKYTLFNGEFINVDAQGTVGGILANTTSYTAFTVTAAASNMTGGTIRVYGYRKA